MNKRRRPRIVATHAVVAFALACGLGIAAPSARRQRGQRPVAQPKCLAAEHSGCGCSLKIVTLACPDGGTAHFFSELNDGAPLWLNLGGREISLRSTRPVKNEFLHGRADSWREDYEGENVNVRIHYRPSTSTCPPEKEAEEGCEYFDVAADVVVTAAGRSSTYRAVGMCGC